MVQTTLQALFRSTITGVVVQVLEAVLYLLFTQVSGALRTGSRASEATLWQSLNQC